MDVNVVLWFLFVTTLPQPSYPLSKMHYFTVKDSYLIGHSYKSLRTTEWLQCLQACSMNERCVSYSFQRRKTNQNCDLHSCGFVDECRAFSSLIAEQGAVFHQLRPVKENQSQSEMCLEGENNQLKSDVALTLGSVDLCSTNINQASSKGTSHRFTATVCGSQKTISLDNCLESKDGRIQLETLKYIKCNCSCESCDEVGDLCPASTWFKKVRRKCEGRRRCRVKVMNRCDDDILRALRILYQCI